MVFTGYSLAFPLWSFVSIFYFSPLNWNWIKFQANNSTEQSDFLTSKWVKIDCWTVSRELFKFSECQTKIYEFHGKFALDENVRIVQRRQLINTVKECSVIGENNIQPNTKIIVEPINQRNMRFVEWTMSKTWCVFIC